MKCPWKIAAASFLLSSSLLVTAIPATAAENNAAPVKVIQAESAAGWTSSLSIALKGVSNERVGEDYRISAVFEVRNTQPAIVRLPDDYELHALAAGGLDYTLNTSSVNVRSLAPYEKADVVYSLDVNREEAISLTELKWVNVDWYTYPKTITDVLSIPIEGKVWQGSAGMPEGQVPALAWGEPFQLAAESSNMVFTPVSLTLDRQQTAPTLVMKMKVHNRGKKPEPVPELILEAAAGQETFRASRIETAAVTLEPGTNAYIHFAVPVKQDTKMEKLILLSKDTFTNGTGSGTIAAGQVQFALPQGDRPNAYGVAQSYTLGETIATDTVNQLIPADVRTSVVGLGIYETGTVSGYHAIVAAFQLTNNSTTTLATPEFAVELTGADGSVYTGSRQADAPAQLLPGVSHIIQYSILIPSSEKGDDVIIRLYDAKSVAPYKSEIAAVHTAAVNPDSEEYLSFYPFLMKIQDWSTSYVANYATASSTVNYSYKLRLNADIQQKEGVMAESSASKLLVEIADPLGRVLIEEILSFTENTTTQRKLLSGETIINFESLRTEQQEHPVSIRLYDAIQTPNGIVKRLVKEFIEVH